LLSCDFICDRRVARGLMGFIEHKEKPFYLLLGLVDGKA
jgi:hypothetical protein